MSWELEVMSWELDENENWMGRMGDYESKGLNHVVVLDL